MCMCVCCQLYEEFCEPFSLWECKLAIIHCSGHCDLALVETIWLNIIESELLACSSVSSNDMMTVLMGKMKALGQEYAGSPRCFPVREYHGPGRCMLNNVALYKLFAGKSLSVKTASWHWHVLWLCFPHCCVILCFFISHILTCIPNGIMLQTSLGFAFWFHANCFLCSWCLSVPNWTILWSIPLPLFVSFSVVISSQYPSSIHFFLYVTPNHHNWFAFNSYEQVLNSTFSQNFVSNFAPPSFVWALISHFMSITGLLLHSCEICTVISQLRNELFWVFGSFPMFLPVNVCVVPQIISLPLPFTFLPVHYSLITELFDAM